VPIPERIFLIDRSHQLVEAWEQTFAPYDAVTPVQGDFFSQPADALVSPANSFGIMDGGLDLAIRDRLGAVVQSRVQNAIVEHHHGELPVGAAVVVPTDHDEWPYLIAAPTMRVPENVASTLNAYLAFRALLLAASRFDSADRGGRISSIVCPGFGTGVGAMSPRRCAAQMRLAYIQASEPSRIPSMHRIHQLHRTLKSVS
jgi:O-acetyl-ADP-ribose deacetylase (regulator of RNase III)